MRLFEGTPWDLPPKCERCEQLLDDCRCPPEPEPARTLKDPATQRAKLSVEKRKRGKRVVVIRGLAAEDNDLPALLQRLKSACGSGGSLQEDSIELQGSDLERVRRVLTDLGYRC